MFIPPGALCSFQPARPPACPAHHPGRGARGGAGRLLTNLALSLRREEGDGNREGGRQRDPQPQPGMGLAPTLPQPATCPHRSPRPRPLSSPPPRPPRPAQAEGKALVLRDPPGSRGACAEAAQGAWQRAAALRGGARGRWPEGAAMCWGACAGGRGWRRRRRSPVAPQLGGAGGRDSMAATFFGEVVKAPCRAGTEDEEEEAEGRTETPEDREVRRQLARKR